MSACLLMEAVSQDPDSGEFVRSYQLSDPFSCYASGISASGKDFPGVYEKFSSMGLYSSSDFIRMYTRGAIQKSALVTWVADASGQVWAEDETGLPTIFESNGSVPIVSATGYIMEYVTMLSRAEVQDASII